MEQVTYSESLAEPLPRIKEHPTSDQNHLTRLNYYTLQEKRLSSGKLSPKAQKVRAGIPVLAGLTPFPFYSTAVTRSLAAIRLSSAATSFSSWPGRKANVPFLYSHLFTIG